MNNYSYFRVAAFQGAIKQGDVTPNLNKTISQLEIAVANNIDVLCMPESYLHGYFESKDDALNCCIDLESNAYAQLLDKFKGIGQTTLLLGINERSGDDIYNTVVVIEDGKHLGKYRKAYTYPPYHYFSMGESFPIFEKKGVRFGVLICIDSVYKEPAQILALRGAQVLFCPCFNVVTPDAKMLNFLNRKSHFISRAFENECWFINSDIVWENDGNHVGPGYATILNQNGEVVCKSEPFAEMQIGYHIPLSEIRVSEWHQDHYRRMLGNPRLQKILNETYLREV